MAICLGINDDIMQLKKRYEALKAKKKPENFVSSFLTDYAAYNLNNDLKQDQGEIDSNIAKNSYSGFSIHTGKNSIGANITHQNSNLIDFDFVGTGSNINNKPENMNSNSQSNKSAQIKDINDIFDSFK